MASGCSRGGLSGASVIFKGRASLEKLLALLPGPHHARYGPDLSWLDLQGCLAGPDLDWPTLS